MLIVLIVQLELNIAALSVDLVNCDLCAVLAGVAVNSSRAGQRAGAANLEGSAGSGAVRAAVLRIGAARSGAAAAGQRRSQHSAGKKHTECFLHGEIFSFVSPESAYPIGCLGLCFTLYYHFRVSAHFFCAENTISDNLLIIF